MNFPKSSEENESVCPISGRKLVDGEGVPCSELRPLLLRFIQKKYPAITEETWISKDILPELKASYVEDALEDEIGELTDLERGVIESLREHEIISENPDDLEELSNRTFGERLADRIASFGGSWKFIITFCIFLVIWMAANSVLWFIHPPDPFPFIFLNLILSCVAAFQAPLIMMSQNRQETRDRQHAQKDYQINLKAELEIRHLHEKMDHLLHHYSERLLEIQQIQVDLLQQLTSERKQKMSSQNLEGN